MDKLPNQLKNTPPVVTFYHEVEQIKLNHDTLQIRVADFSLSVAVL